MAADRQVGNRFCECSTPINDNGVCARDGKHILVRCATSGLSKPECHCRACADELQGSSQRSAVEGMELSGQIPVSPYRVYDIDRWRVRTA